MKRSISTCCALFLFFCIAFGQNEQDLISFNRTDIKLVLDIDLKVFVGEWKSLDDKNSLLIYQKGLDFLVEGDYFPGVAQYGDKAILSFNGRLCEVMIQGKFKQINTEQKGVTIGHGVTINLMYQGSKTHGGGGGSVAVAYSPVKDHLIIGKPPYNTLENGQWTGHGSTKSSAGIYGKEFKRMK